MFELPLIVVVMVRGVARLEKVAADAVGALDVGGFVLEFCTRYFPTNKTELPKEDNLEETNGKTDHVAAVLPEHPELLLVQRARKGAQLAVPVHLGEYCIFLS